MNSNPPFDTQSYGQPSAPHLVFPSLLIGDPERTPNNLNRDDYYKYEDTRGGHKRPERTSREKLLFLREHHDKGTPWKERAAQFNNHFGEEKKVPALQMQFKRIKTFEKLTKAVEEVYRLLSSPEDTSDEYREVAVMAREEGIPKAVAKLLSDKDTTKSEKWTAEIVTKRWKHGCRDWYKDMVGDGDAEDQAEEFFSLSLSVTGINTALSLTRGIRSGYGTLGKEKA